VWGTQIPLQGRAPAPLATCHQVRDGHSFSKPDASRKEDIAISGAGIAKLSAAADLAHKALTDVVL
jgi:ribulose 1,5-bisphosphate synthetase/thiazole synthase